MEAGKRSMDTGGTRFAIGLLIFWIALLALFFALHPNGIANASNPNDALQWLIGEFQSVTGLNAAAGAETTPNNAGAAPTETGA